MRISTGFLKKFIHIIRISVCVPATHQKSISETKYFHSPHKNINNLFLNVDSFAFNMDVMINDVH